MVIAAVIASIAALLGALGEWLHHRRVGRACTLAFGGGATPARWTVAVPIVRVIALGLAVFGCVLLTRYQPHGVGAARTKEYSQHLLFCLDVSPSMYVSDAGTTIPKKMRATQGYEAVRPLLDSVDPSDTRVSVIAFYTKSIPVLSDTDDFELVRNELNALPLYYAFQPGETDLQAGVNGALQFARPWAKGSATLVVISDGDSNAGLTGTLPVPASIAQSIVVGVGDPGRSSEIANRRTRQDVGSLRMLAARLGGEYVDCNQSALPPFLTRRLSMQPPRSPSDRRDRDIGLACVCSGALLAASVSPALLWFGRRVEQGRMRTHGLRGVPS